MAAIESLKDVYYSLEDKWYNLVDGVSEKVPAVGNIVDALEEKNIPTFPLAIVILILILLLLFVVITSSGNSALSVIVTDDTQSAIEGATVIVLQNDVEKGNQTTSTDGKVVFLLPNGSYSIKIDKENSATQTREITLNGNVEEEFTLSLEDATISKAVYLKTANGSLISGSGSLIYKCKGANEESVANYTNGVFQATVSPSCKEIEVLSLQNYNLVNATASFSGNGAVTVEEIEQTFGKVNVTITAESSTSVPAGLRVKLVPMDGTAPIENISLGTAIVSFDNVPVKKYYILITSPDGNYSSYDGSKIGEVKDVLKDTTTQFDVTLQKAVRATTKVIVRDAANNNPILGAEVKLTLATNSNDVRTKLTGATGQVTFDVAENGEYIVTVDHPEYVIGETKAATAGDNVEVLLTKVDASTSNSILVKVVDGKKNPIDNARVVLKKIDPAEPIIGEKTTGASGEAEFFNLELTKSYMATVSKEGFGSVNSTSIQIVPRTQKVLEVVFDIGEGTIAIKVLDPEKNPLSGVSVKAMNYFTSTQEGQSKLTSSDGVAEFILRADKKVYFVVESTGFSKYFSSAIYSSANARTEKGIILVRPSAQIIATLVGVYSGNAEVSAKTESGAASVAQGTYTVRTIVQVPKGSFTEAGLHLRTGKETANVTNLMEEDGLYLSKIDSSGRITMGTTYTPPSGYDKDAKNLTTGNAKWANSVWKNPQEGTYEVEAEITVTETNPNAPLNLFYRAWAKGGSIIKDPQSTSSGTNELYSTAKKRVLLAGATNQCVGSFCKSYTLQILDGSEAGKTKYVNGTIEAKKGVQYLLTADLTNYSGKALVGAVLSVQGKSIDINAISVNGAEQAEKTINLGTVGIDAPIQIQILFTASASGTSGIKLAINSSSKSELDETVTINVKANKKFTFDMVPKVIVPYINNTLFFEATDGNDSLDGVMVSIKSGRDLLSTVETTGEGLAMYELAEPRIGDEITITAKKEGYDSQEFVKIVDDSVLTITPPQINETIKIGEITGLEESVIIQNDTAKNVKITSAEINGDVKSYVDIKFNGTINGTVIEQGKDRNYILSMKLNSNAMRLKEPKDLTGKLIINSEISGTNQSFTSEINIAVRLSMPGMIDSGKCLKVNPATIEFITANGNATKTVTLTNTCTAEGTDIALNDLEAKLSESAKFGTISITGKGLSNGTLTDSYAKLGDYLEKNAEEDLTVTFIPSGTVASGAQDFTISIIGKNILEDKSVEKVEAQIKTSTTMSNLSKCLEIDKPIGGLILDMAPWNMGYGALMGSNYSPQLSLYGGFSNRSSPYGMGSMMMPGMSMGGYGSMGYGAGYSGIGQSGATANNSFQQNSFTIKNSCTVDIEIDLDPDSRVNVSEEKVTISKDSDATIIVSPGYVLGKYTIKVNAKASGSQEVKKKVADVSVLVRKLGDTDKDCIKTNVTMINLNSFIYKPQKYTAYNYCYDTGVMLSRGNNMATIECSAPNSTYGMQSSVPYFQVGMESQYASSYPINSQYSSYSQYTQQSGCASSSNCSLITGTRTRTREIIQGDSGSIEQVDFEVMPSAQYIPQRKLFDSRTQQAGPFQTLGSIRQWGTETDARTNVYGNLNISYTNQYGSGQCMEFPITIEDMWRIGESIDSALNWGDPTARPKDCQNLSSLDIRNYWITRNAGSTGAVPDSAYVGSRYVYIAEPAALRIGPAPTQTSTAYPQYDMYYYQSRKAETQTEAGSATKNCGLLDGIKLQSTVDPSKTGGVKITVSETSSGSLINNSRGSNLMVEVDRSGMTKDCLLISVPVKGTVSRAATFDSQELVWPLTILVTKPGYTITGNVEEQCLVVAEGSEVKCIADLKAFMAGSLVATDSTDAQLTAQATSISDRFLAQNKGCTQYVNTEVVKSIIRAGSAAKACGTDTTAYGMNLIETTKLNWNTPVDCTTKFCNAEMLKAFLLKRFNELNLQITSTEDLNMKNNDLNKLYREALGPKISLCKDGDLNYYLNGDKGLIADPYRLVNPPLTADYNMPIQKPTDKALWSMSNVLKSNEIKDKSSLLFEIDDNPAYKGMFTNLGMTSVPNKYGKTKWYMSLNGFVELIEKVYEQENIAGSNCNKPGTNCSITNFCNKGTVELDVKAFEWMAAGHVKMVRAVYDKKDMNTSEIEKIYDKNPWLNKIHALTIFSNTANVENKSISGSLYLTATSELNKDINVDLFEDKDIVPNFPLTFKQTSTGVGQYEVQINYNYKETPTKENAFVYFGKANKNIKDAQKAASNPLLKSGFGINPTPQNMYDTTTNSTLAQIDGNKLTIYAKVPIRMNATVNGYETKINYNLTSPEAVKGNLMNWYSSNGVSLGADTKNGGMFSFSITKSQTPQNLRAIFYARNGGLAFNSGTNGYRVDTSEVALESAKGIDLSEMEVTSTTSNQSLLTPNSPPAIIQVSTIPVKFTNLNDLDFIKAQIVAGNACISGDTIIWNESKFIQAN
ncbi:MAG: carboxypeptidase-like regulatory domain-containing protein [archaeon]|jgi:hypothetical protein